MRVLLRNKKEKVPSLRQAIYEWTLKPIGLLKIIFLLHSPRKNLHCWNICCAIKEKYADARALLKKIWDVHFDKDTAVIDVFVNVLRKTG
jgi:hypothetical protein